MDDEWYAVVRQDIVGQAVDVYDLLNPGGSVFIIPGGRMDKPVDSPSGPGVFEFLWEHFLDPSHQADGLKVGCRIQPLVEIVQDLVIKGLYVLSSLRI